MDIRKPKHKCKIVGFFSLTKLHGDSIKEERKATSILVSSSVYFTFFSKLPMPSVNGDTSVVSPNPDMPMSPLFVPSNRSPQDEGVEGIVVAGTGAEQESSVERQRLKDARRERRQEGRQQREQRRPRSGKVH
jgi:hypothetical protein